MGTQPGTGHIELTRALMAAAAGELPADLVKEIRSLLEPLGTQLDAAAATVPGVEPAVHFQLERQHPAPPPLVELGSTGSRPAAALMGGELAWLPAREVARLVRAGSLRVSDLLDALLSRTASLQPTLNAFITVSADPAAAAQAARGRLAGVPVALKDLIDTAGVLTTCGSRIFDSRVPDQDAACWELLRNEGAVLLGKANTHEFAAGVTSVNDAFGPVRNPWDLKRSAGGSSGGSAAAVAAGLVPVSLGSDTGGSVRVPASCCGVVGVKPTFGRVPTSGVHPLAWSLDTVGPIARNVADAGLMLDVLLGTDYCESAAVTGAVSSLQSVTVGIPVEWLAGIDEALLRRLQDSLAALRARGGAVVELRGLPDLDALLAVNRVIAYAEGSAAHAYLRDRRELYGRQIRARMEAGRLILAEQYLTAQRLRTAWCRTLRELWSQVHVLVTPVLPCPPPELSATRTWVGGRSVGLGSALVRFTGPFSLAGVPAVSLPAGLVDGLPTAVQIVGPPDSEPRLCQLAAAWEDELGGMPPPPLVFGPA